MKLPKVTFKTVAIDVLIVLIGITGALFFAYHFLRDINATLVRMEESPVGTIMSRYNIVQRRFSDRLAWDRLRNNSPIYNGDVIRTDNLSEVTISFEHGDIISLFSNTLVQVHIDSGGNRIDFSSGELIINTPEPVITAEQPAAQARQGTRRRRDSENQSGSERTRSTMVINTGDQRVRVERGSAIRLASNDEGDLELSVNEGTVVLEEAPSEEPRNRRRRNQENPESAILSEAPERSERPDNTENAERRRRTETAEGIENTNRERRERSIVINTGEQRIRTERGSSIRVGSQDGEIDIAVTQGAMVIESSVTDETLTVETGQRVRMNRQNSRRESDEVTMLGRELLPPPRNRTPADQHTITPQMIIDSRNLTFSWDSVRNASGYILTIFRDSEGFRSTVLETPILTETTYTIENIRRFRGNLYWQVEAVRVSDDGNIEQRGQLRENALIVDIPRREESSGFERTRTSP